MLFFIFMTRTEQSSGMRTVQSFSSHSTPEPLEFNKILAGCMYASERQKTSVPKRATEHALKRTLPAPIQTVERLVEIRLTEQHARTRNVKNALANYNSPPIWCAPRIPMNRFFNKTTEPNGKSKMPLISRIRLVYTAERAIVWTPFHCTAIAVIRGNYLFIDRNNWHIETNLYFNPLQTTFFMFSEIKGKIIVKLFIGIYYSIINVLWYTEGPC